MNSKSSLDMEYPKIHPEYDSYGFPWIANLDPDLKKNRCSACLVDKPAYLVDKHQEPGYSKNVKFREPLFTDLDSYRDS